MSVNINKRRTRNRRYILNIDDEPTKILQPIWGYASEPLVTLTEACRPLYGIVSRLEPHVWVALENSKNPPDNLTQNESAAIYLYTMEWKPAANEPEGSLYRHLNRTLRQVNRAELQPWFRYLKLFLTALAKLPISHPPIIWRGIRKGHSNEYTLGAKLTWWAFTSCTVSLHVLESDLYLGKKKHSHFTTEDEILLLPGTHLEVVSQLNPAPDLHIIHLRQIYPPIEMLEPPFEGAYLLPPPISTNSTVRDSEIEKHSTGYWCTKKKIWIIAGLVVVLIVLAVVLGAVLGRRTSNKQRPPIMNNTATNPPFRFNASANTTVSWSGSSWRVRNEVNSQPGNYNWTSSNVVMDPAQGLYMRLTRDTLGIGGALKWKVKTYFHSARFFFFINASIDKLDSNVEFRMFLKGADNQTKISIDIGRRGQTISKANDLRYTIYPNIKNVSIIGDASRLPALDGTYTAYRIYWMNDSVEIYAEHDNKEAFTPNLIFDSYSTNSSWSRFVPRSPAYVFISLCTYNSSAPTNNQPIEINTRQFIWNENIV